MEGGGILFVAVLCDVVWCCDCTVRGALNEFEHLGDVGVSKLSLIIIRNITAYNARYSYGNQNKQQSSIRIVEEEYYMGQAKNREKWNIETISKICTKTVIWWNPRISAKYWLHKFHTTIYHIFCNEYKWDTY